MDDGRYRATAQDASGEDIADDARGRHPKRVDADDVAGLERFDQDDLRGNAAGDGVEWNLRAAAHQVAAGAGAAHQASTETQLPQGQEPAHVGVAPAVSDEQMAGSGGAHAGQVGADGGQAGFLARSPDEVRHAQITPLSTADGTDLELLRRPRQGGKVFLWSGEAIAHGAQAEVGGAQVAPAGDEGTPFVGRSATDVELRLEPDGAGVAAGFAGVLMDALDGGAHRL